MQIRCFGTSLHRRALRIAALTALALEVCLIAPPALALSADEVATLRAAPPQAESGKTPESLKRYQAASLLAHRLGMRGQTEAVPLLLELRQVGLLGNFAGGYPGKATPELEALALRHLDRDPEVAWRLVAMLRRLRSPELFDALLAALPSGKYDCERLLVAAADADLERAAEEVEPKLARLLPTLHPAFGQYVGKRLADAQYVAGEAPLVELLRRAPLDRNMALARLAQQILRYPTQSALDAVTRKLLEVAALPEDKSPPKLGLIASIRFEDIPKDGLLCSTEHLRTPLPLGDARSRTVAEMIVSLKYAWPEAVLDRSLFGADMLMRFSPEERKALDSLFAERTRIEAMARDLSPENLLHWSTQTLDRRMLKRFIARGIDVNRPTASGQRPLVAAARGIDEDSVNLLLAAGADPNLPEGGAYGEGNTALMEISRHGAKQDSRVEAGVRTLRLLLERKADVNARNRRGQAALHYAASQRPELAMLLLAAGASVNVVDKNGGTPLHRAVEGRQAELAKLLLDRGAEVNAEEMGGVTPLLIAQDNGDTRLARLLVLHGGQVNMSYVVKRGAVRMLYGLPVTHQ